MGNAIKVESLASKIIDTLDDFANATEEVVENAVIETAKETAKEVKANARSSFGGNGDYAESWTWGKKKIYRHVYKTVVYSEEPYYRIAHLLENGHALVKGGRTVGRVAGRPHIAPADNAVESILKDKIKSGIENGGAK